MLKKSEYDSKIRILDKNIYFDNCEVSDCFYSIFKVIEVFYSHKSEFALGGADFFQELPTFEAFTEW